MLTGFLHMFKYLNMSSSELVHIVIAGKEDQVSFLDGENKFEINFRLENCYLSV